MVQKSISELFFSKSKIGNLDTKEMMEFLSSPESVNKMIVASDMKLPALSPVVKELETRFGNCKEAPLNHDGPNHNAKNRQNVGRMVKFIMAQYGYVPTDGGLSENARIPKNAGSKYFSTGAVYEKLLTPKRTITVASEFV